jgi:hypothetical protein
MATATFRFQIVETGRARKSVIWLSGNILEGTIHQGDRLAVPLRDGTMLIARTVGLMLSIRGTDPESVSFEEHGDKTIVIAIWRDSHESEDILCDIASLYRNE